MKILAVDLATTTGVAFGRPLTKPISWCVDFGKFREHDARFAQVLRWVRFMHERLAPDLIVIEAPIGGPDSSHLLIGMVAIMRSQAADLGISSINYTAGESRKHFIGKALTSRHFPDLSQPHAKLAIKGRVRDKCLELGWAPKTLDEADAMALWSYACSRENLDHQVATIGGLFGEQQCDI